MSHFTTRRLAPLTGLLFVVASGAARAQFPPAPGPSTPTPSPSASGGTGAYTTQCGTAQSYNVYTSSDQGTEVIQDPTQAGSYAQALAGSSWNFWQTSSKSGINVGRVTMYRSGQPMTPTPALYTSWTSTDGNYQYYDVSYSSNKLVLHATVTYDMRTPQASSGQVLYTSLYTSAGVYGTPVTAYVNYPMTFGPYTAPPTTATPPPTSPPATGY